MPRDLKKSENNEIVFLDRATDSRLTLFYSTPTTTERIQYKSALVRVALKTKSEDDIMAVQLEWAKKLITGFADGDFVLGDKPVSSDKKNENYYEGWKGLLEETAADLLFTFVETVLGTPNYVVKSNGAEPDFS